MSVWRSRSCLSPASRFRSSRTVAARSFRSVSPSAFSNRSPCAASLRALSPYTFRERPRTGPVRAFPSTKRAGGRCEPASRARGTRPGAAGANRLGANSRRGHARYQRARAESIGAVAQWERITLAVWGSRVRIPPAPLAGTEALNWGGTTEVFRPLGMKDLIYFLKGGRRDERDGKEDRPLYARRHRREVARTLGLVRPPPHARRLR